MTKYRLESLLNYPFSIECEGRVNTIVQPSREYSYFRFDTIRATPSYLDLGDGKNVMLGDLDVEDAELPDPCDGVLFVVPLIASRVPSIWNRADVLFPGRVWCFRPWAGGSCPSYLALEPTDATLARLRSE